MRFDYSRPSSDYDWITINGVHTPIDESGNIAGGANGKFNGKQYTGSKMQRSKKRQEKVGGASGGFKLDKSKIKSKSLSKAVEKYAKEHNGELPSQLEMHDLAFLNLGASRMKARKIQNEYNRKYGIFTVNQAEAAEKLEKKIEEAYSLRDSFDKDDPEWERWDESINRAKARLQEHLDDPDYEKHKKDWERVKKVVDLIDSSREDAKAFLVNKGREFKTAEEVGAWLEVSGWVRDLDDNKNDPANYGEYRTVSINRMDTKFAGALAETIGTFQKDYPKLKDVVTEIALRGMEVGDMGGFDPGTDGIEFASGFFSMENIGRANRVYEERAKTGHFPKGTTVESVGHHEFTHAMEAVMERYDARDGKNVLKGMRPADVVLERVCSKLNLIPIEAKVKVSGYALRDYPSRPEYANTEFLAEAMSEAYTSPNPRPVAVAVREEFTRLYHEIYD